MRSGQSKPDPQSGTSSRKRDPVSLLMPSASRDPHRTNPSLSSSLTISFVPKINAKITAFTKYGTCVPTAKEHLPEHLREHKFIYPPQEVLESLEWLKDPGDFTRHYNRAWEEIKAK